MSKLKIWLLRHGESYSNAGVWSTTPNEVGLTPKGEAQAQAAAEKILSAPNLLIVSPFKRACETAIPIRQRWKNTRVETWPIQELLYLSPKKCADKTSEERRAAMAEYWQHADPYYQDGEDAESFDHFMQRVQQFRENVLMQKGFVVAVGHGQFLKALLMNEVKPYHANPDWMKAYRSEEITQPIRNGEVIVFRDEN